MNADLCPPDLPPLRVLGLMSGTSVDGIDAVLARFERRQGVLIWEELAHAEADFDRDLRQRLLRATQPGAADVVEITQLHAEVGEAYASLCERVQQAHAVDLIALSGQTLYHIPRSEPGRGWHTISTLQVGEASRVVERCRVPTISDFRQADMAAGGGGAPLVAFGDHHLYRRPGRHRVVQNLGGIANLTLLPSDGNPDGVRAFDTGPANCLIDEAAEACFGAPFDRDGAYAARGRSDEQLLSRLLAHPYLRLPPPKTTGREVFNLRELLPEGVGAWDRHDLIATLTEFTARSVAHAIRAHLPPPGPDEVLLAGGGALNPTLVAMLRAELPTVPITPFEELGWRSKSREVLAFALMGYAAWHGLPNTLPGATGARRPVVAGKVSRP
jgi:anhydro-N-acetylmuramic acid kinase